jgi:acetylornithine deacetylase/succinyl-diaminopimelate desuccinylase-like protein
MEKQLEYIETHFDGFLEDLKELLRIPSVSTDSSYSNEMQRCAGWCENHLEKIGFQRTEIINTKMHPVVYAEYMLNKSAPTVLIYGHYDVQPPDPLDLWESDPFDPRISNNNIYARGAVDDKGQLFIILKAIETLLATDSQIACNLKIILEGEEECGSDSLFEFIKKNKEKLQSDIVLACDSAMLSEDIPAITTSLRGIVYAELLLKGSKQDLHSGVYGGAIENPLNVLSKIVSGIQNEHHRVTFPGFYDDVIELTGEDRAMQNKIPFNEKEFLDTIGSSGTKREDGYSIIEATTTRPSFDVHGMWGGYSGEGGKTIIPAKAGAKLSFRLVPNQQPEKIFEGLKSYVEKQVPDTMQHTLRLLNHAEPVLINTDHPAMNSAVNALEAAFKTKPFFIRTGGSIPVVTAIKKYLDINTILMGFALESDGAHSPNEHFGLVRFRRGIETVIRFFKTYS